jgi:hypothetical protein
MLRFTSIPPSRRHLRGLNCRQNGEQEPIRNLLNFRRKIAPSKKRKPLAGPKRHSDFVYLCSGLFFDNLISIRRADLSECSDGT